MNSQKPQRDTSICPSCGGRMVPADTPAGMVLKPHQMPAYCEDCGYQCIVKRKDMGPRP